MGPEATIESLVTWSRFMHSAHIFSLMGYFMHICSPLIVPAIVTSCSVPKYMVERGLGICSAVSDAPLDLNGQVDDFTAKTFKRELEYLGSFIQSLLSLPPLMHRDIHFGIAASACDF